MRKVIVFNNVTLDGYIADRNSDMSWAQDGAQDPEFQALIEENARGGGELLFGRVTYDMMASFWPTEFAKESMPVVAEGMNTMPKVVFSSTLDLPTWNNTRLVKGEVAAEVRKMKDQPGPDMVIFGSGTIISQLAQEGLIDEYQIMVHPIILGQGKTMFEGLQEKQNLKLAKTRIFSNGLVFLSYQPV